MKAKRKEQGMIDMSIKNESESEKHQEQEWEWGITKVRAPWIKARSMRLEREVQ
jgi:hypothetical protein